MKKSMVVSIALTFLFATTGAYAAQSFSADMTMRTGAQEMKGKISYAPQKIRFEMPETVMITRLDKNVSWLLMPSRQMYMEQPIDPKTALSASREVPGEIERKSLGKENVNGRDAEKFEVSYRDPRGGTSSIYQWIASDVPLPVRVASVDDAWSVDYANVSTANPDPALFEVPAGYQRFAMPSIAGLGAAEPPQE